LLRPIEIEEIEKVLRGAEAEFEKEKIVLEIDADDVFFVGDIHADMISATKIFRLIQTTKSKFVFLGDYVDRGDYSVETVIGLFRLKIKEPERLIFLRGNHETTTANEVYGFLTELQQKYRTKALYLYKLFNTVFSKMPISAIINSEIICMHGGVPKGYYLEDIKKIEKGDIEASHGILLQVLWNDPDENVEYFAPSFRGPGIYLYGEKAFDEFMDNAQLKQMIRAHTFLPQGAQWYFKNKLLSLFSPTSYVGQTLKPKIAKLQNNKIKVIDLTKL